MTRSSSISLPRAQLVSTITEGLLNGVFLVLYIHSVWILLHKDRRGSNFRLRRWMLATATLMYLLATAHFGIDIARAIEGFVEDGGTPSGTTNFYNQLCHPTHVAKSIIYATQTMVGDSFVTYRLYIVYNRRIMIVLLPVILLVGTAISGYGLCYQLTQLSGSGAIFEGALAPWITTFFYLTLTTNVLATTLITGRIVWSRYRVRKLCQGSVTKQWGVVETIVQSAAIYSAALVSLISTYAAHSNAQYICLDALQPIIGIVFTLIIIRVGLNETGRDITKERLERPHAAGTQIVHVRPLTRNYDSFVDSEKGAATLSEFSTKLHHDWKDRLPNA